MSEIQCLQSVRRRQVEGWTEGNHRVTSAKGEPNIARLITWSPRQVCVTWVRPQFILGFSLRRDWCVCASVCLGPFRYVSGKSVSLSWLQRGDSCQRWPPTLLPPPARGTEPTQYLGPSTLQAGQTIGLRPNQLWLSNVLDVGVKHQGAATRVARSLTNSTRVHYMLRDSVIVTDATSQLWWCSIGIFSEATLCNRRLWCLCADYNSSDQKMACRRHELYVSFRELGWQVNQRVSVCLKAGFIIYEKGFGLGTDTKERNFYRKQISLKVFIWTLRLRFCEKS